MKIFETIYKEACAARLEEAKVKNVANAIARFTKDSIPLGRIDGSALRNLENAIQRTMMSDDGIEGDHSAKGINKAINYVIQNSSDSWSGGNPGKVKAFFDKFKDKLGPTLSNAIAIGLSATDIKARSEVGAARGVSTVLSDTQALDIAKNQR